MNRARFGAIRRTYLCALALTLSAFPLFSQVVERGRTYADLVSSHPCNSGNSGRLARVTDAQSSSSIGGGGGSVQVWAVCNGVDTWTLTTIGGSGGGVSGLTTADGGTALADNTIVRGDGTTGVQGSTVTVADSTGNLQWEGTTADAFEGNFTFADPTADWTWAWGAAGDLVGAGSLSIDNLRLDGNTISSTDTNGNINLTPNGTGRVVVPVGSLTAPGVAVSGITGTGFTFDEGSQRGVSWTDSNQSIFWIGPADVRMQSDFNLGWTPSATNASVTLNDTVLVRSAAGIVGLTSALHLTPIASPPRTCDATAEGDIYSDTSHALCWCDASTWQKLSGAGTCA